MKQFGQILFSEQVKEIEEKLDSAYFLENENFGALREKTLSDFAASNVRPAAHAGRSYPDNPDALGSSLAGFLEKGKEAILSPGGAGSGRVRALMVPHIDLARGGACYGAGYSELAATSEAATYVILGIAHNSSVSPYVLTKKEFSTPFGTLEADLDFINRLTSRCTTDFYKDEFLHRNEHSIEFQALFLEYLFRGARAPKIVPVLCGTAPRVALSGKSPYEDETVRELIDALRQTLEESGSNVCVVAGVDLSHVGKRFGQDILLSGDFLADLESADRRMIRYILDCDAEGFMRNILADNDSRNVCGVPAIYTLLKTVRPGSTKLLQYAQSVEEAMGSAVTFASIAFYD
jgi:AmmeMemoRadiSam system protein B